MVSLKKACRFLRPGLLIAPALAFCAFTQMRIAEADSHMGILENRVLTPDQTFLRDCAKHLSLLMRAHKEYDGPTYRRIVKLAYSADATTRCDAFALLWTMGSSSHRKEILKLGHKFAASTDESKAFDGISLLQFFGDPSWHTYADRFKDSGSSVMRDLAAWEH